MSRSLLPLLLLFPLPLPSCVATLDHQAELLLHPEPLVQVPSLVGAVPGLLAGAPLWGPIALLAGPESDAATYAIHVFAFPGALLFGSGPWLIAGPSFELPDRTAAPPR